MSWIDRAKQRGVAGFSLLELMVVVAIIGVLAMVAIPRYDIFRARARQSEAKANLGVIFTLQEAFLIEHEEYYDGDGGAWGGEDMNTATDRQGYRGGGTRTCERNKLGYHMANCDSARYGYYIAGADEDEFLAIAYGASDQVGDERVFPGCNGAGDPVTVADTAGTKLTSSVCEDDSFTGNTSHNDGDAWCVEENRNVENYRDIVEYCGANASSSPSPTPAPGP